MIPFSTNVGGPYVDGFEVTGDVSRKRNKKLEVLRKKKSYLFIIDIGEWFYVNSVSHKNFKLYATYKLKLDKNKQIG